MFDSHFNYLIYFRISPFDGFSHQFGLYKQPNELNANTNNTII